MTKICLFVWTFYTLVVLMLCAATPARAQCEPSWRPFDTSKAERSGILSGTVYVSTMWDPDGPGPQTPKLVVGGSFSSAGNTPANNIAFFDYATSTWWPLGAGTNDSVRALAVLANGDLVAGGLFTTAGSVNANCIARWNGSAWSALGSGLVRFGVPPRVNSLAALPNGDLVVGGSYDYAGGVVTQNIARWNGSTWSSIGPARGTNGTVLALRLLANGNLVAGGSFTAAGGVSANNIARWDGSNWFPLASGLQSEVASIAVLSNGDLVAGGGHSVSGGLSVSQVNRWNGSAWTPLGAAFGGLASPRTNALVVLPNGNLVAGGVFTTVGGVDARGVALWTGSQWTPLGTGIARSLGSTAIINALTVLPTSDLIAGGAFDIAGGELAYAIARWSGSSWFPLRVGVSNSVKALALLSNGDVLAGGDFRIASGVVARHIARWNGTDWMALGEGLGGVPFPSINALAELHSGDLVAGGGFTTAGGVGVNRIARWDGAAWSALSTGVVGTRYSQQSTSVDAMAVLRSGDLVVEGNFTTAGGVPANQVARWNGAVWTSMGLAGAIYQPTLSVMPTGDLLSASTLPPITGVDETIIMRWDGASWMPLTTGVRGSIAAMAMLPNGKLIIAGSVYLAGGVSVNRIASWDGFVWSPLGAGLNDDVDDLAVMPNGDLIACGEFTSAGGVPVNYIARWNGTVWSSMGAGLSSYVNDLEILPNGDLIAAGEFIFSGTQLVPYIARWSPPRLFVPDQPDHTTVSIGESLVLTAALSPGPTGVSVQWQRNGVNINNGPGGASVNGGSVSGAVGVLPSPITYTPVTFTVFNAQPSDGGAYTAVFTNACGSVTTQAAMVTVQHVACTPSDIAGSGQSIGPDGVLTADDIILFINWFFLSDARADIAGQGQLPTPDGQFTADDIHIFVDRFFSGC